LEGSDELIPSETERSFLKALKRKPITRWRVYTLFIAESIERSVHEKHSSSAVSLSAEALVKEAWEFSVRLAMEMTKHVLPYP
jgi:hypothetical protein